MPYKNKEDQRKFWLRRYYRCKEKFDAYKRSSSGIYIGIKSEAKKRKIFFNLIKEDFIKWYNSQEEKCCYCDRTLEDIKRDIKENAKYNHRLSIDRKDNIKGYELDNLVLACWRCNAIKSDCFTEQEMLKIGNTLKEIFNNR